MSFCTTRFHLSTEICNIRLPHPIFSGLNMDAEESLRGRFQFVISAG